MISKALFSSASAEWSTPRDFYEKLDRQFCFELDAAATHENHKAPRYYTKEENGLALPWAPLRTFCNPPYGRTIFQWVEKAYEEWLNGALVVMLLPARTDTKWFQTFIYHTAEVKFISGRLKFGGSKNAAPFPSMLAIYSPWFP